MEKHYAVVKGNKTRLLYRFGMVNIWGREYGFIKDDEVIEETVLWDGELSLPLLEEGDYFYIEDLELEVTITRRVRSSNGQYLYETHYKEQIEDEKTLESKKMVEMQLKAHNKMIEKLEKETIAEKDRISEDFKKRTWFEKWFGN